MGLAPLVSRKNILKRVSVAGSTKVQATLLWSFSIAYQDAYDTETKLWIGHYCLHQLRTTRTTVIPRTIKIGHYRLKYSTNHPSARSSHTTVCLSPPITRVQQYPCHGNLRHQKFSPPNNALSAAICWTSLHGSLRVLAPGKSY